MIDNVYISEVRASPSPHTHTPPDNGTHPSTSSLSIQVFLSNNYVWTPPQAHANWYRLNWYYYTHRLKLIQVVKKYNYLEYTNGQSLNKCKIRTTSGDTISSIWAMKADITVQETRTEYLRNFFEDQNYIIKRLLEKQQHTSSTQINFLAQLRLNSTHKNIIHDVRNSNGAILQSYTTVISSKDGKRKQTQTLYL